MAVTVEDIEVRARLPPDLLLDMKWIYNGGIADTASREKLKKQFDKDSWKFFAELRGMDREWRSTVAKMGPVKSEVEASVEKEVVEDGGTERAEEMVRRLIKEATGALPG